MRSLSFVLIAAFLGTSVSACVVESGREYRRPAASGPAYRNHGQERREEVHERNAERKAEKEHRK